MLPHLSLLVLVHPERLIRTLAQPKSSPLRGSLRLSKTLRVLSNRSSFQPDTPNKKGPSLEDPFLFGAPGEIRTPDQVVRSHLLYPAELRMRAEREYIEVTRDGHPKIFPSLTLTPPPLPAPPHSPDWPSAARPGGSSAPSRARPPGLGSGGAPPACALQADPRSRLGTRC